MPDTTVTYEVATAPKRQQETSGIPTLLEVAPGGGIFYDVAPDGEHFVMLQLSDAASTLLHVVVDWLSEVERLVPTD